MQKYEQRAHERFKSINLHDADAIRLLVVVQRGVLQQSSTLWKSVAAALLVGAVLGICTWRSASLRQGVPPLS